MTFLRLVVFSVIMTCLTSPGFTQVKPGSAMPPATNQVDQMSQLLNDVVAQDSRSWMFNRYDNGSMHNGRILSGNSDTGDAVVQGDYTYNGGRRGWVRVSFADNRVRCVTYHDFPGTCRPVGAPNPAFQALASLLIAGAGSNGTSPASQSQGPRQCRMVQEQICPPDGSYCRTYNVERCD